ncbi:protein phosphatase PTC7, partial [Phenoliferia sp. Uapishka_3]
MLHLLRPTVLPRELIRIAQSSLSSRVATSSFSSSAASSSAAPRLTFTVGTAFHGKPQDPPRKGRDGKLVIPPTKVLQGFAPDSPIARWRDESLKDAPWGAGHDWLFQAPTEEGGVVVGVADGVGGWEESGVDPSHFAQALMFHAREEIARNPGSSLKQPREIMKVAYDGVKKEKGVVAGSSTACILSFDSQKGLLNAANLGDSTFLILRDGKVIHSEPSQCHFFNAPRQLSKLPAGRREEGSLMDSPRDAAISTTPLQRGDIIFAATDGFSDNVHLPELEQISKLVLEHQVRDSITDAATMDRLALACVNYARLCSFKEDKVSPFELEARNHRINFPGGKVDDVTVVTVLVS